jgi:hypothetical protein
MRSLHVLAIVAVVAAGCVTPVVLEDPLTHRRVNCTLEAERLAYDAPNTSTGADVPWPQRASPTLTAFDLEQQCVGFLVREGFVCVTGCPPPRK